MIYHGFRASNGSPSSEREALVLTVGNVSGESLRRKGHELFVRTAALVPEARFVLAGRFRDDAASRLRSIASANVELTGYVSDRELEKLIEANLGYLIQSQVQGSPGVRRSGEWKARIPAERFKAFQAAVLKLGEQRSSTVDSQDVTSEYYDLKTRVKNREAREAALRQRRVPVHPGRTRPRLRVQDPAARAAPGLEPPLAHERGPLVQPRRVIRKRDALDDAVTKEGRDWYRMVGAHVRPGGHRTRLAHPPPRTGAPPALARVRFALTCQRSQTASKPARSRAPARPGATAPPCSGPSRRAPRDEPPRARPGARR